MNFGGSAYQQSSLEYLSAGKVGFITGSYVVIIPFIEYLMPVYSKHLNAWTWIAAFMNLVGLYLLSGCAESDVCIIGSIGSGEQYVLISVLFWVVSIMVADEGCKLCDVVDMSIIEFSVPFTICILTAYVYESDQFHYPYTNIMSNITTISIVGITDGLAFLLASLGQREVKPSRASLLLSLESLSTLLIGYIFLNEVMSYIELFGGLLMFIAVLLSTEDLMGTNSNQLLVDNKNKAVVDYEKWVSMASGTTEVRLGGRARVRSSSYDRAAKSRPNAALLQQAIYGKVITNNYQAISSVL